MSHHYVIIGRQFSRVSHISIHLVSKTLTVLCSKLSDPGDLCHVLTSMKQWQANVLACKAGQDLRFMVVLESHFNLMTTHTDFRHRILELVFDSITLLCDFFCAPQKYSFVIGLAPLRGLVLFLTLFPGSQCIL